MNMYSTAQIASLHELIFMEIGSVRQSHFAAIVVRSHPVQSLLLASVDIFVTSCKIVSYGGSSISFDGAPFFIFMMFFKKCCGFRRTGTPLAADCLGRLRLGPRLASVGCGFGAAGGSNALRVAPLVWF